MLFSASLAAGRRVGTAAQVGWFRLLVAVHDDRQVRGWSRHATNLTARLGALTAAFAHAPAGSVFDGELVAVSERDGHPVQDFAAVCRAVMRGDTSVRIAGLANAASLTA